VFRHFSAKPLSLPKWRPIDSQYDSGHGHPRTGVLKRAPVKNFSTAASIICAAIVDFPAELVPPLEPWTVWKNALRSVR
jgi:hypothetical protein